MIRLARALGLAGALLLLAAGAARAQCPPGHYESGDWCIPNGHIHCGGGKTCPANTRCMANGTCLPAGAVDCGNGAFCPAGRKCASGGTCIGLNDTDCGNGKHCSNGQRCGPNNSCLAAGGAPPDATCPDGIGLGQPKPVQCITEGSGRNCSCLNLRNNCPFAISVRYSVSGVGGSRALTLDRGESSGEQACTSRPGQSITYQGWRRAY